MAVKKVIKLVNNERANSKLASQKACDATSEDICFNIDNADCTIYAYDKCTKADYAACFQGADDVCVYDNHTCPGGAGEHDTED